MYNYDNDDDLPLSADICFPTETILKPRKGRSLRFDINASLLATSLKLKIIGRVPFNKICNMRMQWCNQDNLLFETIIIEYLKGNYVAIIDDETIIVPIHSFPQDIRQVAFYTDQEIELELIVVSDLQFPKVQKYQVQQWCERMFCSHGDGYSYIRTWRDIGTVAIILYNFTQEPVTNLHVSIKRDSVAEVLEFNLIDTDGMSTILTLNINGMVAYIVPLHEKFSTWQGIRDFKMSKNDEYVTFHGKDDRIKVVCNAQLRYMPVILTDMFSR